MWRQTSTPMPSGRRTSRTATWGRRAGIRARASAALPASGFAGAGWADWLFMIGLLGIGVALIRGIAMRIAAASAAVMLIMMWSAVLPPANNPFMDDHILYALVVILLALIGAGTTLGLGRVWSGCRSSGATPS